MTRKRGRAFSFETALILACAQVLFSVTLALSVNLLELTVFEILDVLPASLRWMVWKFDLAVLSILVSFILPFVFFRSLFTCVPSYCC